MLMMLAMYSIRHFWFRFVLDGYPLTERQIHLLNEQHIVPHKVIQLEVSNDEVLVRGAKDRLSTDKLFILIPLTFQFYHFEKDLTISECKQLGILDVFKLQCTRFLSNSLMGWPLNHANQPMLFGKPVAFMHCYQFGS